MAIEIEHKYLVKVELWKHIVPETSYEIKQGYITSDINKTVRVRTKGNVGYITIKGKSNGSGRLEFEYEIPICDAQELLLGFCSNVVEKTRHLTRYEDKLWEVDEFHGLNKGLFVAEIELMDESENYSIPIWADKNVTDDSRYANSNLAERPYLTW